MLASEGLEKGPNTSNVCGKIPICPLNSFAVPQTDVSAERKRRPVVVPTVLESPSSPKNPSMKSHVPEVNVGRDEGVTDGSPDGLLLGRKVGKLEGDAVGTPDGETVGKAEGDDEGGVVGDAEGDDDGAVVGAALGALLGALVGVDDGMALGEAVGPADGEEEGGEEGISVGSAVGVEVGAAVGLEEGLNVVLISTFCSPSLPKKCSQNSSVSCWSTRSSSVALVRSASTNHRIGDTKMVRRRRETFIGRVPLVVWTQWQRSFGRRSETKQGKL
jgi:hypothetical protein